MSAPFKSLERLAHRDASLRFRSDAELGVVVHLRGALADRDEKPERAGLQFMREHRDLFGAADPESLAVLEVGEDPGGLHAVFEQRHDGVRVLGGSIRFHCDRTGRLDTVANHLFPDLAAVPQRPELDAERAVDVLRRATGSKAALVAEPEPIVVRHEGRPHLAWEVHLDTDSDQRGDRGEPTRWIGYVDAVSGDLLLHYNNIQTAAVTGAGTGYYSGAGPVNAWSNGAGFQLRDTTRTATGGPEILTNDEDGASPSEDADNNWNAVSTSPRHDHQGPEVDAHRYAGNVVDYYRSIHGRNSFDGAGATLTNLVHVGTDYSNGYWDGTKVNLGDGSGVAPADDYECSDDWLAHEWTHAFTQYTCGLIYYGESGALERVVLRRDGRVHHRRLARVRGHLAEADRAGVAQHDRSHERRPVEPRRPCRERARRAPAEPLQRPLYGRVGQRRRPRQQRDRQPPLLSPYGRRRARRERDRGERHRAGGRRGAVVAVHDDEPRRPPERDVPAVPRGHARRHGGPFPRRPVQARAGQGGVQRRRDRTRHLRARQPRRHGSRAVPGRLPVGKPGHHQPHRAVGEPGRGLRQPRRRLALGERRVRAGQLRLCPAAEPRSGGRRRHRPRVLLGGEHVRHACVVDPDRHRGWRPASRPGRCGSPGRSRFPRPASRARATTA